MMTGLPTRLRPLLPLLALFGQGQPMPACRATSPDASGPASRLELASGTHDGVAPAAIAMGHSRWRSVTATDGQSAGFDIATQEIVRWGECPPWPSGPMLLLADGGVIAGRITATDGTTVGVESLHFGRLELPADVVRGYRVSQAIGPAPLAAPTAGSIDRTTTLLLANGDRVSTRRLTWRDDTVTIESPFRQASPGAPATAAIPARLVRAVDFAAPASTALRDGRRPRIFAATSDGSRFTIAALEPLPPLAGADRVRLTLPAPADRTSIGCDADEIRAIAVDGGRASLLATVRPDSYDQSGDVGPAWPLARNAAVTGGWPSLRGATAFSAIGIHAPARIRYRLDGPATRFESLVAIDDTAAAGGSVRVRVLAGDETGREWELFSSPVLRGGDRPLPVNVDLAAAHTIDLVVDTADGGDVLDRTLWLDPIVVRESAETAGPP